MRYARGAAAGRLLPWLAVAAIGATDVIVGQDVSLAPFYMLVVGYSAWRNGMRAGNWSAIGCAIVGLVTDYLVSEPRLELAASFSHPLVPWWNWLARWAVFLGLAVPLARLRASVHARESLLKDLEQALRNVRTLEGMLPICAWCKKMRDDENGGGWVRLEEYIAQRTPAQFTHGICPTCAEANFAQSKR